MDTDDKKVELCETRVDMNKTTVDSKNVYQYYKEWYKILSDRDNASAQYYSDGSTDKKEARKWYRRLVNQNCASVEFKIGLSYYKRNNYKAAIKWFELI